MSKNQHEEHGVILYNNPKSMMEGGYSVVYATQHPSVYEELSQYAANLGYTVKVLNLAHPEYSDTLDVVGEFEKLSGNISAMAGQLSQAICDGIEANTGVALSCSAKAMLLAFILYTILEMPRDKRNLRFLADLTEYDVDTLNAMIEDSILDVPKHAFRAVAYSHADAEKALSEIRLHFTNLLSANDNIANVMTYADIEPYLPANEKCLYIVFTSPTMVRYNRVVGYLFFWLLCASVGERGIGGKESNSKGIAVFADNKESLCGAESLIDFLGTAHGTIVEHEDTLYWFLKSKGIVESSLLQRNPEWRKQQLQDAKNYAHLIPEQEYNDSAWTCPYCGTHHKGLCHFCPQCGTRHERPCHEIKPCGLREDF